MNIFMRGVMILRKVLGREERMVSDFKKRTVMTQDSALRVLQKWHLTKYDSQNRPDSTGLMTDPSTIMDYVYHDTLANKSTNYPL